MRNHVNLVFCAALIAASMPVLYSGVDAQNPSVSRHKADIVKAFSQAEDYLAKNRLQDVRSTVELLNRKLDLARSGITPDEASSIKSKIDNIAARASAKEDSLVKVTVSLLYSQGPDSALAYLQNDLKRFGVSEKKTETIEKKILLEGPKIKREIERQALERTIKALQAGQTPPPGLDPYILAAAKRAIKAHADSIAAAENEKKRRQDLEKQRQERIRLDKIEKEKKLSEEKEAKKRAADAEAARKKAEAALKARQDSIAAVKRDSSANAIKVQQQERERQRKIDEQLRKAARLAKAKDDSAKQVLALREKAKSDSLAAIRRDSIAAVQKAQQERDEKEKEQQRALLAEKKKQELARQAHDDSLAALQKAKEQQEKDRQARQSVADRAQALAVDLYDLLDKKQSRKALEKFEQIQGFLVSAMDPEAYKALDHAVVCGTIMELAEPLAESKKNRESAISPQRKSLDKIYYLVKDDKIEAAYTQFKLTERSLTSFMVKGDFNQLKALIEGAYLDRKKAPTQPAQ